MNQSCSPKLKTYHIITYGCAMNLADTERFRTILDLYGLQEVQTKPEADILIFNTCSVRQKAEDRVYGLKKEIAKLKIHNPRLITVLTGCMARRKIKDDIKINSKTQKTNLKRADQIKAKAEWLDIIVETKNFQNIAKGFQKVGIKLSLNKTIEKEKFHNELPQEFLDYHRSANSHHQAGITISHGCDHMCTFCIVPFARGREIHRDYQPIIKETLNAINTGAKEIVLLGQTVNRWINPKFKNEYITSSKLHTSIPNINTNSLTDKSIALLKKDQKQIPKAKPKDFLQLIQTIDQVKGDYWLSFISSHPNYYTKELISYIAKSVKGEGHLRPYLHLALQSGDNEILKKMRRNHTIEEFIEKVNLMKELIPQVSITTDIITGFPSETDKQFENTLNICKQLKFDQIYISEYSERSGTGSSFFKDDVAKSVKKKRKKLINENLKKNALEFNQKLISTRQRLLIIKKEVTRYHARTIHNKPVTFHSSEEFPMGSFVNTKIVDANPFSLKAEIV